MRQINTKQKANHALSGKTGVKSYEVSLESQTATVVAEADLPYEKVLRKYRGMSPVFVRKCDRDGDSLYTNVEMQCVAGIYQAMYISK